MKKIVMLTCPHAETVCTGAGCFSALNGRTHRFREYGDEELQVSAFMKCSGCGHFPRQDKGLDEKSRGFWKYIRTQFIWESAAAATGKVRLFVKRWR